MNVTIPSTRRTSFSGYLAKPDHPTGGALVVLQEIFGVNENIRACVDYWAGCGYVAIAPDLFWRQEPGVQLNPALEADRDKATTLMKGLDQELAVKDAFAALEVAAGLAGADAPRGALGYCLGGKIAFLMAARGQIDAAVSYYGVGIQGALGEMGAVSGALLLHIAEEDHLCPPDAQVRLIGAVQTLGSRGRVEVFPGVGHAFARVGGGGFNAEAAARANSVSQSLLQSAFKILGPRRDGQGAAP